VTANTLTLALNFDPKAVEASRTLAEAEAQECESLVVDSDLVAGVIGEYLIEKMRIRDAVVAVQKSCADPIYKAWKTTRAIFDPEINALDRIRAGCDRALSAYRLQQVKAQAEALALATTAVAVGDVPAMTAALQVANAPTAATKGVSIASGWVAEVIAPDLLLPEFTLTVPNHAKINAHAAAFHETQTPTPIPGVKFTLVAGLSRVARK